MLLKVRVHRGQTRKLLWRHVTLTTSSIPSQTALSTLFTTKALGLSNSSVSLPLLALLYTGLIFFGPSGFGWIYHKWRIDTKVFRGETKLSALQPPPDDTHTHTRTHFTPPPFCSLHLLCIHNEPNSCLLLVRGTWSHCRSRTFQRPRQLPWGRSQQVRERAGSEISSQYEILSQGAPPTNNPRCSFLRSSQPFYGSLKGRFLNNIKTMYLSSKAGHLSTRLSPSPLYFQTIFQTITDLSAPPTLMTLEPSLTHLTLVT
jgi:hypothetical protein